MSIEYESLKQSISPQSIQERIHVWESMMRNRSDHHSLKQAVVVIRELEQQNQRLVEALELALIGIAIVDAGEGDQHDLKVVVMNKMKETLKVVYPSSNFFKEIGIDPTE